MSTFFSFVNISQLFLYPPCTVLVVTQSLCLTVQSKTHEMWGNSLIVFKQIHLLELSVILALPHQAHLCAHPRISYMLPHRAHLYPSLNQFLTKLSFIVLSLHTWHSGTVFILSHHGPHRWWECSYRIYVYSVATHAQVKKMDHYTGCYGKWAVSPWQLVYFYQPVIGWSWNCPYIT